MSLNKSKGNMYSWVTHTWNPFHGCLHDCKYCYLKVGTGSVPKAEFFEDKIKTNLGKGRTIFVGSAGDLFGSWVPKSFIMEVLAHCRKFDNIYLFQTKNPRRFSEFLYFMPGKRILGTTIETNRIGLFMSISKAPSPTERALSMKALPGPKEVTIEPIMNFDLGPMVSLVHIVAPKFVVIGADSKGHDLPEPSKEKIESLIRLIKAEGIEVKVKANLSRLMK